MSIIVETPFQNFTGLDGKPLTNGKVYIGQVGTDPTVFANQIPIFWDEALTIPAAQPLTTNAGYIVRFGTPARVWVATDYSISVKNASNILVYYIAQFGIFDYVEVSDLSSSSGASLVGFIQVGAGAVVRTVQDELRDFVKPEQFGALGGGENDTLALQRAIATGRDVYFSRIYTYQDVSLNIATPGQKLFGPGGVIQKSVSVSNIPADPTVSYPASSYPAILMSAAGGQLLIGSVTAAWEGVQMAAADCQVRGVIFTASEVNHYDGILAYNDNPIIIGNVVRNFGVWRVAPAYMYKQRGDGIFLSSGAAGANRGGIVMGNHVIGATKNGFFMIGYHGTVISGNMFEACGMSAIQIAFLNGLTGGNACKFSLTGNVGRYCGADSIDINNSSGSANEQLFASSTGNTFDSNGFMYPSRAEQLSRTGTASPTQDGAGYTLIAVSDLRSTGNYFYNCGRTVFFATSCARIAADDEGFKISTNVNDDTDGVRLVAVTDSDIKMNLTVPGHIYRAEGNCSGTILHNCRLRATGPTSTGVTTPNGTTCPIFRENYISLVSGTFVLNGIHPMIDCTFSSTFDATARFVGDVELVDTFFTGRAITVNILSPSELTMRGVKILGNSSTSGLLQIQNCLSGHFHDLRVENAGSAPAILFYGPSPSGNNYLRNITAKNTGGGNSLRIEAEVPASVTFYLDEIVSTPGFPDLSGGTKKYLTWA